MALSLPNPLQTRRSKTILSPEGTTAKFLYTIIKQLDLKTIDWNEVASQLDISNGHAARMRYSRFKSQIESLLKESKFKVKVPTKDAKVKQKAKEKRDFDTMQFEQSSGSTLFMEDDADHQKRFKHEPDMMPQPPVWNKLVKTEQDMNMPKSACHGIKSEPGMQHPRIQHPTITAAGHAEVGVVHNNSAQLELSSQTIPPKSKRLVRQTTTPAPSINSEPPTASNAMAINLARAGSQQCIPHMNYVRPSPQRQQPFRPYQSMFPHYGSPPRFHYQYPPAPPMYRASPYEVAAQAAYPWPYSEATVSQFARKDQGAAFEAPSTDTEFIGIDEIDFGKFASEFEVIDPETNNLDQLIPQSTRDVTAVPLIKSTDMQNSTQVESGHEGDVVKLNSTSSIRYTGTRTIRTS